jgi:hypothetical protein
VLAAAFAVVLIVCIWLIADAFDEVDLAVICGWGY